jgi:hypothetical protein
MQIVGSQQLISSKPNINDASAKQIAKVPGLGEHLSNLIADNAPFVTWTHVKNLRGIGESRLNALKTHFDLWAGGSSLFMNTCDFFQVGNEIQQDNFIKAHKPLAEQCSHHGRLETTRPSMLSLLPWRDGYNLKRAQIEFLEEVERNTPLIFSGTAVLLKSRKESGIYSHALTAAHCLDSFAWCRKLIDKLDSIRDYSPKGGRITAQRRELLNFICDELEVLLNNSQNKYGYVNLGNTASQLFYLGENGEGNYQAKASIKSFEFHPNYGPEWKSANSYFGAWQFCNLNLPFTQTETRWF